MIQWPRYSCIYAITGTKFLRLGSSAIFDTYGGNAQNWEKGLRQIFVPDGFNPAIRHKYVQYLKTKDLSIFTEQERAETKIFVNVDQSGAEALVVGKLAKAGNAYELMFANGIKPHSYLCTKVPYQWEKEYPFIHELAALSIPDCAKDPRWKALDKAVKASDNNDPATRYYFHYKGSCHMGNYDGRANKLQMKLLEDSGGEVALTKMQAEEYLISFHAMAPEIREWHATTIDWVRREKGIIYNCFGFPLTFTGDLSDEGNLRDVLSAVPQSTVGTLTNIAYTKLQQEIEDTGRQWDLVLNTHDAYAVQCPIGEEEEVGKRMQWGFESEELESPLRAGVKFRMKSEVQIGMNLGPAKKPKQEIDDTDPTIIDKYNLDGLR